MNRKYLYLIPLVLLEVIFQLAFFWLASPYVFCYWTVYMFGTLMSLIHIGLMYYTGCTYGARRGAAIIVGGSVCQLLIVIVCAVLLENASSVRNAVFSLLIASMFYAVVVTLLLLSVERDNTQDTGESMGDRNVAMDREFMPQTRRIPNEENIVPPLPIKK